MFYYDKDNILTESSNRRLKLVCSEIKKKYAGN